MGNRTIYLPDELDELSRRLGLNLSQLTQRAIEAYVAANRDEAIEARVEAASTRCAALGMTWPRDLLQTERDEAGER